MRRLLRFSPLLLAALLWLSVPATAQTSDVYVVQAGDTLFRIARTHAVDIDVLRRLNAIEGDYITVGQTLRLSDRVRTPPPSNPPRTETPRAEAPRTEAPRTEPPTERPADPPTEAAGSRVHVVQAGETLFRIALRYGTSVETLRRLNRIESDQIEIGQRLIVSGDARPDTVRPTPETPIAERPEAPRTETPQRPVTRPVATRASPVRAVQLSAPRPWSINDTTIPADLVHFSEPGETLYSIAARYGVALEALVSSNALSTAPLAPGTAIHLPTRVRPSEAASRTMPDVSEAGLALVYPDVMSGRMTQSGEAYDPLAFTASHRAYPFGTILLVTNPTSGRSTFVRVIDRGPVSQAYLIELSAAAATTLELDPNAARRVEIREVP